MLKPGAIVSTLPVAEYRMGDLAAYVSNRETVCHRILKTLKSSGTRWYLMKGDANFEVDGWIPEYRLIGRVTQINGKKPNECLGTILAFFFRYISKGKVATP